MRRRLPWFLFGAVVWLGGGWFAYYMGWAGDRRFLLPGATTAGHHQIELACAQCHTPFLGVKLDACNQCHAAELAAMNDLHPRTKFTDPRNADRLKNIDAAHCVTCHREHQPEFTRPMGVTQPDDYCYHCHQDIADVRPSHAGLKFYTCATAGCHNFHDNTALYEDFIAKHLDEPDMRTPALRLVREIAATPTANGHGPLASTDRDVPADVAADQQLIYDWEQSAHARAAVNCSDCHQAGDPAAAWIAKPTHDACARCHTTETTGFLESRHGMRLAAGLSPMTPALARIPMRPESAHRTMTCNACHATHRYDTSFAAADACLQCHDDEHSRNYRNSPHYELWRREALGAAPAGTGVSCATCHLPRETHREGGHDVVRVQHNQNATLRPNEKMIRPVCLDCHGYAFALDALADRALIDANFTGRPARHLETVDWVARRLAPRSSSSSSTTTNQTENQR